MQAKNNYNNSCFEKALEQIHEALDYESGDTGVSLAPSSNFKKKPS